MYTNTNLEIKIRIINNVNMVCFLAFALHSSKNYCLLRIVIKFGGFYQICCFNIFGTWFFGNIVSEKISVILSCYIYLFILFNKHHDILVLTCLSANVNRLKYITFKIINCRITNVKLKFAHLYLL